MSGQVFVHLGPNAIGFPEQPRQWVCSVCLKQERWADGWASWDNLENASPLFVTCSNGCRESDRGKELVEQAKAYRVHRDGGWVKKLDR